MTITSGLSGLQWVSILVYHNHRHPWISRAPSMNRCKAPPCWPPGRTAPFRNDKRNPRPEPSWTRWNGSAWPSRWPDQPSTIKLTGMKMGRSPEKCEDDMTSIWGFPKINRGTSKSSILMVFSYKPSIWGPIWGYPHSWKPPYHCRVLQVF